MDDPKKPKPSPDAAQQEEIDRVRALILQRRNRFIAAALAGIGAASQACTETHGQQSSVLPPGVQEGGAGGRAGGGGGSAGPSVCLQPPLGGTGAVGGIGGFAGAPGVAGAQPPMICLSMPIEECWDGQPPPCVCLEPPFVPDDDAGVDNGSQ